MHVNPATMSVDAAIDEEDGHDSGVPPLDHGPHEGVDAGVNAGRDQGIRRGHGGPVRLRAGQTWEFTPMLNVLVLLRETDGFWLAVLLSDLGVYVLDIEGLTPGKNWRLLGSDF